MAKVWPRYGQGMVKVWSRYGELDLQVNSEFGETMRLLALTGDFLTISETDDSGPRNGSHNIGAGH